MTIPFLYITSLLSGFITFLCWLWIKDPFTEETCQKIVLKHLFRVRSIHLLNHFVYGLVWGNYLVLEDQSIWLTLLSAIPIMVIFVVFWLFLRKKLRLVKSRLFVPSSSGGD